jgi:hypothetical protein
MRPGYLFLFIMACACSPEKTQETGHEKDQASAEKLLEVFENVSADTIHVFASDNVESKTYAYNGFKLDSLDLKLFPKEFSEDGNSDYGFYACKRFKIDDERTGLIVRSPGEYVSSSLKLFIYNSRNKTLDYGMELADVVGDAGWLVNMSAKLFFDRNRKLNCILRRLESYDHSAENENDTIVDKSIVDYHIDLSRNKADTFETRSILNRKCYYDVSSSFTGILKEEEFYGPPGYGENKATDPKELALMLYLTETIDLIGTDDVNDTKLNVSRVQVLTDQNLKERIGKRVTMDGKLVGALTGHHHAGVLLDMKQFY